MRCKGFVNSNARSIVRSVGPREESGVSSDCVERGAVLAEEEEVVEGMAVEGCGDRPEAGEKAPANQHEERSVSSGLLTGCAQ